MSQYLVGIDLGTTHTVVAYAKRHARAGQPGRIELLEIAQWIAPGQWAGRTLLPSVRYHAAAGELAAANLPLAGSQPDEVGQPPVVIGQWARQLGTQVPGRLVSSAKSWLSHPGVDRQAAILPWGSAPDVLKVSPVEASASYLRHVRAAWEQQFPKHPLAQQELVLTVPASFDEAARALTLSAARQAGLPQLRLLEEPQAVFYDWLLRQRSRLAKALQDTRLVLVCDVGGGTTDLSLIQVTLADGEPQLTRIGVGHHLMLGGDNMDLALAHRLEPRLTAAAARPESPAPESGPAASPPEPAAGRLTAGQFAQLMERCRSAKEQLLAANAPAQLPITLLGGGARLVGASRSTTLTREEVEQLVVEGFFPSVPHSASAAQARKGLVEFGLPYARDAAVTRHLADFLRQHDHAMPDTLLLNGGVFHAEALVQRLQTVLADWRGSPLRLLHNDNPDVAVARGAVAYALAQHGLAPKIGGGAARSYFLLLDAPSSGAATPSASPAEAHGICILPRGTDTGVETRLAGRSFALRLGQPVRFQLFSTVADAAEYTPFELGQQTSLADPRFVQLPPIATVLEATSEDEVRAEGQKVLNKLKEIPVQLVTTLTEVGTLEVHCESLADSQTRWLLAFDLRHHASHAAVAAASNLDQAGGATSAADATVARPGRSSADSAPALPSATRLAQARQKIQHVFAASGPALPTKEVKQLRLQLEQVLGERSRWATPELRQLFDALWQHARGRKRSVEHERVWLNLAGFCLRPGFGDPLDAWRLQQLWAQFAAGVQHSKDKQVCTEWWTLWRRVAGGLAAPEQLRLLDDFGYNLYSNERGPLSGSTPPVKGSDDDMLRLGASLERIPVDYKQEIGDWLLARLQKSLASANKSADPVPVGDDSLTLWALGRIGAREPLYGHSHDVVPPETASAWIEALLALDWKRLEPAAFACVQLARVTDDRTRDLSPALRSRISARLPALKVPTLWQQMLQQRVTLDAATERRMFGEALPPGLTLIT